LNLSRVIYIYIYIYIGISRVYVAQTFHSGGPNDPVVNELSSLSLEGGLVFERKVELGGPGAQPVDVAVDAPSELLFVSTLGNPNHHPGVYVVDRQTFEVRGKVPTPRVARAVACRPGTGLAYAVGEGGLTVIDGHNLAALTTVPLGQQPFAVAVDPTTGVAYVGDRFGGTLTRIDAIAGLG
jgi:DNA-binding beta-propeller fold protein YncE